MAWQTTLDGTSPRGQYVEYRQNIGGGYSSAEAPAHVVVSGRVVVKGWSCDGTTYAAYARAVREGWTEQPGDIDPVHTCGPGINWGCDVPGCEDTD